MLSTSGYSFIIFFPILILSQGEINHERVNIAFLSRREGLVSHFVKFPEKCFDISKSRISPFFFGEGGGGSIRERNVYTKR